MERGYIRPDAVAYAYARGGVGAPNLFADIKFYQREDGVLLEVDVSGLPKTNKSGFYGFHIHEGSSCGGKDFSDAGGHYNPKKVDHPSHAGDLPPLLSNNGDAYMQVLTNRFTVREIIGRTVIIHSDPDDFTSQPSGNSGTRIACATISMV